ncbi:hypothetical protein CAPTEDRAFT_207997 [Capitella teleta]|uniref:Uncharacterized protein n=1 Tax=Capitella teleta TaxID=283909 RepID=R7TLN4_CAPTE|nr:hypothetical protein CAPTEDRAFT_207997 [Capitella teleta]|eukprot:ELT94738.1 hypothetical protein CAPTEDRAFT_207997 [Capitella teleta]
MASDSLVTTAPPTLTAEPFALGPAPTIWGLSVEHFAYIFLIIGGTAPVLFIVVTVITMKCYSWRRRRRFVRYATEYRAAQEAWQSERKQYANQRNGLKRPPPRPPPPPPPSIPSQDTERTYVASTSNPNVYFKDSNGVSTNDVTLTVPARSGASSPNLTQITDISQEHPHIRSTSPIAEIGKEEANALAAFDRIYENLDVSVTTEDSCDSSPPSNISPRGGRQAAAMKSVAQNPFNAETSQHHFVNPAFEPDFLHES